MDTGAPSTREAMSTRATRLFVRAVGLAALALLASGCDDARAGAKVQARAFADEPWLADASPDGPSSAREQAPLLTAAPGESWMAGLDDELALSQLTIPGTHDSMALHEPFPGTAKCQNLGLWEQLDAGVRFIDIRCRHFQDSFTIHHGSVYQHANFDDVLATVTAFLEAHPSEAVVMSIKEEHTPSGNTRSFVQTFESYVAENPSWWNLDSTIPRLGEARGKITLFRRFAGSVHGIHASSWPDKTTFTAGNLRVQDVYGVSSIDAKWAQIQSLLAEARAGDQSTLYLNFASGVGSILGIPNIPTIANPINRKLGTFFTSASGRYGIIVMDFADAAHAAAIYQANGG